MIRRLALIGVVLALSPAAAQQRPLAVSPPPPPPPPSVPPPVVATSTGQMINRQKLLDYRPGDVRCGSETIHPERVERPLTMLRYGDVPAIPVMLRFRIDSTGRPLSIVRESERFPENDDLLPSFAAWQFPDGARADCSISFYPVAEPIETVSPAAARRYLALGGFRPGQAPRPLWDRAQLPGGCVQRWPQLLTQSFPRFDTIAAPPASLSATFLGFDIDGEGVPTNIRTLDSDGNAALDVAGREAIAKWRYAEGPRSGCTYPYHRRQQVPLAPPEAPDPAALRDPAARCDTAEAWQTPPVLTFPDPYRKRAIEGWAIIAFDVAPWGATGNVRVLAAEPTSDFGDAAKRVVEQSRKMASETGASGCTERVRFAMTSD
ncbi:energy transducer TonB [Sphingomonas qomolangmaensis]|uniref:Energy transducer TonB n=1 Tax=Sphingomonas qomolangmaensis TaxID=2918765 RepID=A0ABY5LAX5_9SPHN|nr:energy transducer TonB [Sphingomonas qomolangmaensis]UUL83557.1 energy transducer TonB [Sphingomonas qomolangmaensis]